MERCSLSCLGLHAFKGPNLCKNVDSVSFSVRYQCRDVLIAKAPFPFEHELHKQQAITAKVGRTKIVSWNFFKDHPACSPDLKPIEKL